MSREIIRCHRCQLNQFMPGSGYCRKCRISLVKPVAEQPTEPIQQERADGARESFHLGDVPDIAFAVKLVRLANELSQRDLAKSMGVPRTYISKVENGAALPTLDSIEKLARGLNATAYALITIGQAAIIPA